jgi:7-cyano-7-deazaguanine synthase
MNRLPPAIFVMSSELNQPQTGLLLSGGVDSSVLLGELLAGGARVTPFYVRTGSIWETAEMDAVRRFLAAVASPRLSELLVFDMRLDDLYGTHWSMSGAGVPDKASPDAAVYLPGRNPLMLLKPALWCTMHGIERLALATLANNPFADATSAFFASFEEMLHEATGRRLEIARPFEHLTKDRVLEIGWQLPLGLTFSCLAPVGDIHCGHCNKCAERQRAFRAVGIIDPTQYATPIAGGTGF